MNAMNEDELRKSVRRQKFERQGLSLPTATTPTGTGSSSPSQSQVSYSRLLSQLICLSHFLSILCDL